MSLRRPEGSAAGLVLGTAQLGMDYGIANRTGRPAAEAAHAILDAAVAGGVVALDTARAYGGSEAVIGAWLRSAAATIPVITKLAPLATLGIADRGAAVRASLGESLKALGVARLGLVLAHREEDLLDAAVRDALEAAREEGILSAWGVSATRVHLLEHVLAVCSPAAVQVPASVADRRYLALARQLRSAGAVVFARSPFLQGALLMPSDQLPGHLSRLAAPLRDVDDACAQQGCSRAALLLALQRAEPAIDGVVFGVETVGQLSELLASGAQPPTPALRDRLIDVFAGLPDEILDPGRWPR